ncbi:MAG: hypothetical protein HQL28_06370, partial [Candidatus Omnitrophica bacterium]|nr:hypothetical protein [Candidatus Omnitrophota bacterium]
MRKNSLLIKVISLSIALLFTHEQIGWVQEGIPVWADLPNHSRDQNNAKTPEVDIPDDLGEIQSKILPNATEKIIQIQDTHASLSAQESIAQILGQLSSNYDVNLIGVEGAEGFIDTSLLRSCPDKQIRENTARYLMKSGKLCASEFFSVTSDKENILLVGMENKSLYEENLAGVREIIEKRDSYVNEVRKLQRALDDLSGKIYSKELIKFEKLSRDHRKWKIGFPEYYKGLISLFPDDGKILEKAGQSDNIKILLKTVELEKEINFKDANSEREKLIDLLGKAGSKDELEQLVTKVVLFKEKKISQVDFYTYLGDLAKENNINPAEYANFIKYTRYISLYGDIDILSLYLEVESLEDGLVKCLYENKDQERLYQWRRLVQLFLGLYDMEFSNSDFEYLCRKLEGVKAEDLGNFLKENSAKYGLTPRDGLDLGSIFGGVGPAVDFYRKAEARNKCMIDNTILNMRKEGKNIAALVTGGFHTKGLTELISGNNLSYLVITPKYEEGKTRPYIAILTNKKKPYQKLLDSGKYEIAVPSFFGAMDEDKVYEVVLPSLAQAALRGEEWKVEAGKWADKYATEHARLSSQRAGVAVRSFTVENFRSLLGISAKEGNRLDLRRSKDGRIYTKRITGSGETRYDVWEINGDSGDITSEALPADQGNKLWFGFRFMMNIPLKNLFAPRMDTAKYALRLAWLVDTLVFYTLPAALPVIGPYLIFGHVHWTFALASAVFTLSARWVYFNSHPDVLEVKYIKAAIALILKKPLPDLGILENKYIAPLEISLAGVFLAMIPSVLIYLGYSPYFAVIMPSLLLMRYHSDRNRTAVKLQPPTGSTAADGSGGSGSSQTTP